MELLLRVEDVFTISGRGCVISAAELQGACRRGDTFLLRTPAGRELHTYIHAIEMVCGPKPCQAAIMLPQEIKKEDVPLGTEVWRLQGNKPQEAAKTL